jgi:hypothetical protein
MINTINLKININNANIKFGEPRVVADNIEKYTITNFYDLTSIKSLGAESRRDMKDLSFNYADKKYILDIKTHNTETEFNRPNITSIARFNKLYTDKNTEFGILMYSYKNVSGFVQVDSCEYYNIWNIHPDCLTFGNLGTGQIQIKDSSYITPFNSKKEWFEWYFKAVDEFYKKEKQKIDKRITDTIKIKSVVLEGL